MERIRGLNPFRAGRCLSTDRTAEKLQRLESLNPFRAGRCLSTENLDVDLPEKVRLNPFRAGRCLSTDGNQIGSVVYGKSQSLSSRAMSFDKGAES